MTFCRSPFSFTTLELAKGLVFGTERFDTPAPRDGDPIPALEAAILPAVAGEGPCVVSFSGVILAFDNSQIGREVAVPVHLRNGEEFQLPIHQLLDFGRKLFTARWTSQEGAGR